MLKKRVAARLDQIINLHLLIVGAWRVFLSRKPSLNVLIISLFPFNTMSKKKFLSLARKVIIGLCRKSTDSEDKQIRSLKDQQDVIVSVHAKLEGEDKDFPLEIVTEAKSAFHPGRPEFNKIMRRIDKGEIHAIMVLDPTRLSRNPEDSGALMQRLADGRLACVITADGKRYSRQDTALLLMLTLEGAISWKDSADKGKRVSISITKKAEEGGSIGPAPLGYRNAGLVKGKKWMEKDPITAPKVVHLFTLAAAGCHSLDQLCKEADKMALRSRSNKNNPTGLPISKTMVNQMLKNPVYMGKRPFKGKLYTGTHPALVKPDVWKRAQSELTRRCVSSPRPKEPQEGAPYIARGCLKCGVCRRYMMSAYIAKQQYIIYECKGRGMKCRNCINQEMVKDQLYEEINKLELQQDPDVIRREIIAAFIERQDSDQACRAATEKELTATTNDIGRLFLQRDDARHMGALDAVDARIHDLQSRKGELEGLLAGMGESYDDLVEQALRCFELQKLALEAIKYASLPVKQIILKSLASNYFVKSKSLVPEWRSPFLEKSESDGCKEWLPGLDSNQQPPR